MDFKIQSKIYINKLNSAVWTIDLCLALKLKQIPDEMFSEREGERERERERERDRERERYREK